MKILNVNLKLSNFVFVETSLNESANTFLLDTGSDISIIKQKFIKNLNTDDTLTYKLKGIGEGTKSTLGFVETNILLNNFTLNHKFQVVDNDFPIPCDGIIGDDFIKTYNCLLDFNPTQDLFVVRPNFSNRYETLKIYSCPKENTISLPARAEVIRKINVDCNEPEFLIPN